MAVYGVWQREGNVMSLIAGQLQDLSPLLGGALDDVERLPLSCEWH